MWYDRNKHLTLITGKAYILLKTQYQNEQYLLVLALLKCLLKTNLGNYYSEKLTFGDVEQ